MLGFLYLVMRLYRYIIIVILFNLSFSNAQTDENVKGTKIDLKNVDVGTKALPTLFLFGTQYTFRERNKFIKNLLQSQYYLRDLSISIDLEEFYTKKVFRFNHKGKVEIYLKLKKLPQNNKYNSFMLDGAAYSELNITRLISTITDVRIDSIQKAIIKRKKLLAEWGKLNNEISDIEVSLDQYKSIYDDIIVSKKLSDKKYEQLQGLEKISVLQKKYRTVKRKIAKNIRDRQYLTLIVVSIY